MAKINDNLLTRGARGNVGKQFVYRKRGDDTHITKMPSINKDLEATSAQVVVRELFAAAALYAKGAISSPELKKEYQKKAKRGNSAYNMAFRDYLKAPVVKHVYTSKYNGSVGSTIEVIAKDDFRVAEVKVSIRNISGVLVEEGNAVLSPLDRNKWIYTARVINPLPVDSLVTATATDLPGNTKTLSVST